MDELGVGGDCIHYVEYKLSDENGTNGSAQHVYTYVDNTIPYIQLSIGNPKISAGFGDYFVAPTTNVYLNSWDQGCDGGVGLDTAVYEINIVYFQCFNITTSKTCSQCQQYTHLHRRI